MQMIYKKVILLLLLFPVILLSACSASYEDTSSAKRQVESQEVESYSFYRDGIKWDVEFNQGEIAALSQNGRKIPAEEIDASHKKIIARKLGKIRNKLDEDAFVFKFDGKKLKKEMSELKKKIKKEMPGKIKIQVDKETIDNAIKELHQSMKGKKGKQFKIHFNSEEFKEEIKNLSDEFKKLDFKELEIEINNNLKEAEEELSKIKIDIDDMEFDFEGIELDLDNLDHELDELDVELELLDSFMEKLKMELMADAYIKTTEEGLNFNLSKEKLLINDKTIPDKVHQKYLNLYKNHFGKEVEDEFEINSK